MTCIGKFRAAVMGGKGQQHASHNVEGRGHEWNAKGAVIDL
jgi:hypothetical protein